jgi:hypothetical protein
MSYGHEYSLSGVHLSKDDKTGKVLLLLNINDYFTEEEDYLNSIKNLDDEDENSYFNLSDYRNYLTDDAIEEAFLDYLGIEMSSGYQEKKAHGGEEGAIAAAIFSHYGYSSNGVSFTTRDPRQMSFPNLFDKD